MEVICVSVECSADLWSQRGICSRMSESELGKMIRSDFAGQSGHGNSAADINSYRLRQDLFSDSGSKTDGACLSGMDIRHDADLAAFKGWIVTEHLDLGPKHMAQWRFWGYLCDK